MYKYTSEKTALLKRLKTALTRHFLVSGRIRLSGSGFLAEEIVGIYLIQDKGKELVRVITPTFTIEQPVSDYNVRELEEMIRYLERW